VPRLQRYRVQRDIISFHPFFFHTRALVLDGD
jgi:hypothetical protein